MTILEFEKILDCPESSILDFKSEMYDFSNDTENHKLAKFIKDLISFSNTIRQENAYIIFGVEESPDGIKVKVGIQNSLDDAILQDKVKDKIYPRVKFQYSTIFYQEKLFGVLEFPIVRYEMPITTTIKLKGLETGKVYFRQGSMNCEALALEVIRINEWLKSLPNTEPKYSIHATSNHFISRLLRNEEKISLIINDLIIFAKEQKLTSLLDLCLNELSGFDVANNSKEIKTNLQTQPDYLYRTQNAKFSLTKINPNGLGNITPEQLKHEIDQHEDFFDCRFFFRFPLYEIEEYLNKTAGYAIVPARAKDILPKYKLDDKVYIYVFNSNFRSIYQNIRQKLMDELMRVA